MLVLEVCLTSAMQTAEKDMMCEAICVKTVTRNSTKVALLLIFHSRINNLHNKLG